MSDALRSVPSSPLFTMFDTACSIDAVSTMSACSSASALRPSAYRVDRSASPAAALNIRSVERDRSPQNSPALTIMVLLWAASPESLAASCRTPSTILSTVSSRRAYCRQGHVLGDARRAQDDL